MLRPAESPRERSNVQRCLVLVAQVDKAVQCNTRFKYRRSVEFAIVHREVRCCSGMGSDGRVDFDRARRIFDDSGGYGGGGPRRGWQRFGLPRDKYTYFRSQFLAAAFCLM